MARSESDVRPVSPDSTPRWLSRSCAISSSSREVRLGRPHSAACRAAASRKKREGFRGDDPPALQQQALRQAVACSASKRSDRL